MLEDKPKIVHDTMGGDDHLHEAVTGNMVVGHQSFISRCDDHGRLRIESRMVAKNRQGCKMHVSHVTDPTRFGSWSLSSAKTRGGRVCAIGRHSQWNGLLKSTGKGEQDKSMDVFFSLSICCFSPLDWTTWVIYHLIVAPSFCVRQSIRHHLVSLLDPCHFIILANPVLACD